MAKRETSEQSGFAVASWLALDRKAYLPPTVGAEPSVNCVDEFALTGQKLQALAGVDAFCDWQGFEKLADTFGTGQARFAPRWAALARFQRTGPVL
jgi:hypothetical protein